MTTYEPHGKTLEPPYKTDKRRFYELKGMSIVKIQDPVVQSIVSLTISLRHKFVKQISA